MKTLRKIGKKKNPALPSHRTYRGVDDTDQTNIPNNDDIYVCTIVYIILYFDIDWGWKKQYSDVFIQRTYSTQFH